MGGARRPARHSAAVLDPGPPRCSGGSERSTTRSIRRDPSTKDDFAASIASELRYAGIQARIGIREVNYREVPEAIVDTADEIDADLIVVGSRGHSEIAAMALGSVSHKVAAHFAPIRPRRPGDLSFVPEI